MKDDRLKTYFGVVNGIFFIENPELAAYISQTIEIDKFNHHLLSIFWLRSIYIISFFIRSIRR